MRRLVLLAAAASLAAGCSSSDDGSGIASLGAEPPATATTDATTADTGADSNEEALLAFTQCMRDNGVDIGDPIIDSHGNLGLGPITEEIEVPEGADPEELFAEIDAVFEECGEHLEGVTLGFEQQDVTEFEDTLLEFTQCMRDNGIEMDDPDLSGGGGLLFEVDPSDPDFEAAQEACEDILAGFGPGLGPPPGGDDNV